MTAKYYQHGDVLLKSTDKDPNEYGTKTQRTIVREGEVTGHAHRMEGVAGKDYAIFTESSWRNGDVVRYLVVFNPTRIIHEEHKPITLPPGNYEIDIVREYDHFLEEQRRVRD